MKKKISKRRFAFIGMLIMTAGLLTACMTSDNKSDITLNPSSVSTSDKSLKGNILMAGSTSMEKLANALAESYMEENPEVTVTAEFVGSGAGIAAVNTGTSDIGNSSRALTEQEIAEGSVEHIVAIDGIAIVLDKANKVTDLTKDQLVKIYTGSIRNWKELGGLDQPIVVIGREAGSGTRSAFEELLELEDKAVYSNELDSTGAVIAKVSTIPGAIGYVSFDVVNDMVIAAKLEGMAPIPENIKTGDYFLSRPFVMTTKGEITAQSQAVQSLFDYIYSDKGTELIKAVGLIPVN